MLEIKNLSKSFDNTTVLENLSFSFEGNILGICGVKKSGKSVLLDIICGTIPPSDGEVLLFGENLSTNLDLANKSIGHLLEKAPAPSDMTPVEFLNFVGSAKKISKQKLAKQINAAIDITGLEEVKNVYIKHLSLGQRKILGIAQALLGNPKLIVLDDPFSKLTRREAAIMKSIIVTLGEIKPVIVSARDSAIISDICTEIITLSASTSSKTENTEDLVCEPEISNEEEKEEE